MKLFTWLLCQYMEIATESQKVRLLGELYNFAEVWEEEQAE